MGFKWIVCDLDETLLNSSKKITAENRKAIELLKTNGKLVTIATGRHDLVAKKYFYELGLTTPIIACGGALVKDIKSSRVLYKKLIKPTAALEIINFCELNQLEYLVYTPKAFYYSENSQRINFIKEYNRNVKKELQAPYFKIRELDPLNEDVIKVLVVSQAENIIKKLNRGINKDEKLAIVQSEKGLIDITSSGVSKGDALIILSKHLDVDLSKTIVFGDNHNDISMFKVAGLSIAVNNAEMELKQAADYITLSNNESGVSHAIFKYVLKQKTE